MNGTATFFSTLHLSFFCSCNNIEYSFRVTKHNVIVDPGTTPTAPEDVRGLDAGSVCWCDASGGMIPPDAVEGGNDGEPLFVGRAHHEGALIPGKVKPSHSVCYIAWGGSEHGKSDYQVSDRAR